MRFLLVSIVIFRPKICVQKMQKTAQIVKGFNVIPGYEYSRVIAWYRSINGQKLRPSIKYLHD